MCFGQLPLSDAYMLHQWPFDAWNEMKAVDKSERKAGIADVVEAHSDAVTLGNGVCSLTPIQMDCAK